MSERAASFSLTSRRGVFLQIAAALLGAALVAALFALAGQLTHLSIPGAIAGVPIGAMAGWGMLKGSVRPYVVWMLTFSVITAWLGVGCDANPHQSFPFGAIFGAFMTWRRILVLVAGVIGFCAVNDITGFVMGCAAGWVVANVLPNRVRQLFTKRTIIDRPSYASLREHKT